MKPTSQLYDASSGVFASIRRQMARHPTRTNIVLDDYRNHSHLVGAFQCLGHLHALPGQSTPSRTNGGFGGGYRIAAETAVGVY